MEILILSGIMAIFATLWAVPLLFVYCFTRTERRLKRELHDALRSIVEPPVEGQPSLLAAYTDQLAILLASRLVQQVKTTMSGIASGEARQDQAENSAALAGSNPWLYLLSTLLPRKFRNKLMSVPQFTGQLAMFGNNGRDHNDASVRTRIQKEN